MRSSFGMTALPLTGWVASGRIFCFAEPLSITSKIIKFKIIKIHAESVLVPF